MLIQVSKHSQRPGVVSSCETPHGRVWLPRAKIVLLHKIIYEAHTGDGQTAFCNLMKLAAQTCFAQVMLYMSDTLLNYIQPMQMQHSTRHRKEDMQLDANSHVPHIDMHRCRSQNKSGTNPVRQLNGVSSLHMHTSPYHQTLIWMADSALQSACGLQGLK